MTFSPIRLLLVVLLLVGGVWFTFDQLLEQRDSARSERDQALRDRDAVIQVANETARRLAQASANDTKHTQELSDALKNNQDLQRAVADRNQRLLVKAACPAVFADSSAAGMADGGTAELAADARPDYFTLRDQLALSRQMILGLQDHVRSFCTTQPTTTGTSK